MTKIFSASSNHTTIILILLTCVLIFNVFFAPRAEAQTTSNNQETMMEIINLLSMQVAQLQKQLALTQGDSSISNSILTGGSQCLHLTQFMYEGVTDASTGGEVSALQRFLVNSGDYPQGEITGYYGPATQAAVKRWQARNGVVTGGTPESTGYGLVGSKTLRAFRDTCAVSSSLPSGVVAEMAPDQPNTDFVESIVPIAPEEDEEVTVSEGTAPRIEVTYPKGGETLSMKNQNTAFKIEWTSENLSGDVSVHLKDTDNSLCFLDEVPVTQGELAVTRDLINCTNISESIQTSGQFKASVIPLDQETYTFTAESDDFFTFTYYPD